MPCFPIPDKNPGVCTPGLARFDVAGSQAQLRQINFETPKL
jgi:hypothetical protein